MYPQSGFPFITIVHFWILTNLLAVQGASLSIVLRPCNCISDGGASIGLTSVGGNLTAVAMRCNLRVRVVEKFMRGGGRILDRRSRRRDIFVRMPTWLGGGVVQDSESHDRIAFALVARGCFVRVRSRRLARGDEECVQVMGDFAAQNKYLLLSTTSCLASALLRVLRSRDKHL